MPIDQYPDKKDSPPVRRLSFPNRRINPFDGVGGHGPDGFKDITEEDIQKAVWDEHDNEENPLPPDAFDEIMQRTIDREIADENKRDMMLLLGIFMACGGVACFAHALGWF